MSSLDPKAEAEIDRARSAAAGLTCPRCGARSAIPLFWGLVSPVFGEAEERGDIVLGGCVISIDPEPDAHCTSCGYEWASGIAPPQPDFADDEE